MLKTLTKRKETRALRTTLSIQTLRRLALAAERTKRLPVVRFQFSGHAYYPSEDWTMIPTEEFEKLREDARLLDGLEAEVREDPLLLHNLDNSKEFPKHPRGLGLLPFNPRTLRDAIKSMLEKP